MRERSSGVKIFRQPLLPLLGPGTIAAIKFDARRLRARLGRPRDIESRRLHLGCGARRVPGWLNVDVSGSDLDVDLTAPLPFEDGWFDSVVSQHVIEHLELHSELIPLLRELHRVTHPGSEVWLSCPEMDRICASYIHDGGVDLLRDRNSRYPDFTLHGAPAAHIVNDLFQQSGEHKNLLDFQLLSWALAQAGFSDVERADEAALHRSNPAFPHRNDDQYSLYVRATR